MLVHRGGVDKEEIPKIVLKKMMGQNRRVGIRWQQNIADNLWCWSSGEIGLLDGW